MTESATNPLTLLGDSSAAVCDGDFCAVPERHDLAIVKRPVEEDRP